MNYKDQSRECQHHVDAVGAIRNGNKRTWPLGRLDFCVSDYGGRWPYTITVMHDSDGVPIERHERTLDEVCLVWAADQIIGDWISGKIEALPMQASIEDLRARIALGRLVNSTL